MKKAAVHQFTHSHIVLDDGAVTFKCASDESIWPWLALHPFDPIVVQTINYWVSVETGTARGTFDPAKWSALTQMEWTCGRPGVGHAAHGVADAISDEEVPRYRLTFFDAEGSLVYRMSGIGVVFKTRDFESWRKKAKKKIVAAPMTGSFHYAPADAVGVVTKSGSFVSPLTDGDTSTAQALITAETGFAPMHPYHSGSGDHVNSTHLADVARQFVNLVRAGEPVILTGGEMHFKRYVELDRPFDIELVEDNPSQNMVTMAIHQADRICARVRVSYEAITS